MVVDTGFGLLGTDQTILRAELPYTKDYRENQLFSSPSHCLDKLWSNREVLLSDGSLSPCFVDGPLLALPGILILSLAPFALSRLSRKPKILKGLPWFHRTKLVSSDG